MGRTICGKLHRWWGRACLGSLYLQAAQLEAGFLVGAVERSRPAPAALRGVLYPSQDVLGLSYGRDGAP